MKAYKMKAYKGFKEDMTCKGFQYEEGKEYETEKADCCNEGFHACEYPLDCFSYYPPNESVFHEVEQSGDVSRKGDDSKVASTKIKIGAKLNISGLVKAAIEFTMSKVKLEANANEDCVEQVQRQDINVQPRLMTLVLSLLRGDIKAEQKVY